MPLPSDDHLVEVGPDRGDAFLRPVGEHRVSGTLDDLEPGSGEVSHVVLLTLGTDQAVAGAAQEEDRAGESLDTRDQIDRDLTLRVRSASR